MTTNDKPRLKSRQVDQKQHNSISQVKGSEFAHNKRSSYSRRSMQSLFAEINNLDVKKQGNVVIDLNQDKQNDPSKLSRCFSDLDIAQSKPNF